MFALVEYFAVESAKQKTAEQRWFLITELVRLLNQ